MYMHLHTEIYSILKSTSELFNMNMKSLDSFILESPDNWVSCKQTRHYGDTVVEFLERSLAETHDSYLNNQPPPGGRQQVITW